MRSLVLGVKALALAATLVLAAPAAQAADDIVDTCLLYTSDAADE